MFKHVPRSFCYVLLANVLVAGALVACTKKAEAPAPQGEALSEYNPPAELKALIERGKTVYVANCTSCHGVDPKKDGTLGPAIHGSSLELVIKRVMEAGYPEGYQPKRSTKIMQAMPFLKDDLKALHAYLNRP